MRDSRERAQEQDWGLRDVSHALDKRRPRQRGSLEDLLKLRMRGWSLAEIGRHYGVTRQRIHKRLGALDKLVDPERVRAYQTHRVELMEAAELRMLCSLVDDDVIAKGSLNNRAYTFTQIHQARRLESDQSTANLALHSIVEAVERDRSKMVLPSDVVETPADRRVEALTKADDAP